MKRILRVSAIVALTILFLVLFLRNTNLSDVWAIMKSTSAFWFAIALLTNFTTLIFRTLRWQTLLTTEGNDPPPFYPTFSANTIGYMLSTVLPIRAGDVARPALLSRRTRVRFSTALGTVLTERVLDLACILLLFDYFALVRWSTFRSNSAFFIVESGAIAASVILVALAIFIVGLYNFRDRVRRAHEWLGRFVPARFRESWMRFFDAFVKSLDLVKHPAVLARVLICTAGIWFCLTAQFWFVTFALHRPLPFDASFFTTAATTVSMIVPTPGGVGGFHATCRYLLTSFYEFDRDGAVALALIFHVVGTLPVLATGLVLFIHEGLTLKEVSTEAVRDET